MKSNKVFEVVIAGKYWILQLYDLHLYIYTSSFSVSVTLSLYLSMKYWSCVSDAHVIMMYIFQTRQLYLHFFQYN